MNCPPFHLEDSLGFIVGRTHRAMIHHLNQQFAERGFDVSFEHWIVLVSLSQEDGLSQQYFADRLSKGKSTIARLLDAMEERHLVVRIADKGDRRNNLVYLTKKGRGLRAELGIVVADMISQLTADISPDDVAVCKRVLCRLFHHIQTLSDLKN